MGYDKDMKHLAVALVMCLLGCSSPAEPEPDASTKAPQQQSPAPVEDNSDDGPGKTKLGPCGIGFERQTFVVDGGTWTVIVPALCDPFYNDHGVDPQPM